MLEVIATQTKICRRYLHRFVWLQSPVIVARIRTDEIFVFNSEKRYTILVHSICEENSVAKKVYVVPTFKKRN